MSAVCVHLLDDSHALAIKLLYALIDLPLQRAPGTVVQGEGNR